MPEFGGFGGHDEFGVFEEAQIGRPSAEYRFGSDDPYGFGKAKSEEYRYDDSPYYEQYNVKPEIKTEPLKDGYKKSWKILRSEKIETETIDNPDADNPGNRYLRKQKHKVREKLPYLDSTIGYDREYAYPVSEVQHDLENSEKNIDVNNAKTDPFYSEGYEEIDRDRFEDKPKKYSYFYKYPTNDELYDRNVLYVNAYINKNNQAPEKSSQKAKQSKKYDFGDLNSDFLKTEKYQAPSFDHGLSKGELYRNYKTDGPSYGYY